jgi:demethylmenaquinone methyltransferase/2-methoxy-6-polyprenyl-1,4-benzoquinol methylase
LLQDSPRGATAPRSPIAPLARYYRDETTRRKFVDELFDAGAHDYDFIERLLGLGTGPLYRRAALRRAGLAAGMRVLDIATGTGLTAREARALAGDAGSVLGLDPSAGMLGEASTLRIPLVRALGERIPLRGASFDFACMGFALRHVSDLAGLFAEIHRVLAPGGTVCVLEITRPRRRLVSEPLRVFMTRIVPALARIGRRGTDAQRMMDFYWDTIDACVPPESVLAAIAAAGFRDPSRTESLGMFSEYVARK